MNDFDIYHLGVSGGKDSTAVLLWLIYESGLPLNKIVVTCCDTGNEDDLTYAFLALLTERVFPIEYIFPERDFWEMSYHKNRFPSRRARFCTQYLKIIPSREYTLKLTQSHNRVLLLNGVRSSESHSSNNRGELKELDWDESSGCQIFRPILDWSIDDVWQIHKKYLQLDDVITLIEIDQNLRDDHKDSLIKKIRRNSIPRNPLYDMGASRVGCFPCINSAKKEIRSLAKYRPERIDFIELKENSFDNLNGFSSMFSRTTVPKSHRSKKVKTTKGKVVSVPTIRDVVAWSGTAYGGRQYEFDIDSTIACDIRGACE